MISVVIPLFNKEQYISDTLKSVFNQTYQDYEILVVNDGSTDSSVSVVQNYNDSRIRIINQQNSGVSATRNRGIQEAKGEFVAFLDADDEWKPEYLEQQHKLTLKYPDCDVFCTRYVFKDKSGVITHPIFRKFKIKGADGIFDNYFDVACCSNPPLWTSAVMVRKSAIMDIGGFPTEVSSGEDLLTWARLAAKYKIAFCTIPLSVFNTCSPHSNPCPSDLTSTKDFVGTNLIKLSEGNPSIRRKINKYVGFWYRMRCVINIPYGTKLGALKCGFKSLYYNPLDYKAYICVFFILLPKQLSIKIFKL